jgi:hypothetical protein
MKTIKDFQRQAREKNIERWDIHSCSICGYNCGYIIRGDVVTYDSGCRCIWMGEHDSSWEELSDHYNRNTPEINPEIKEEYTKKVNDFWGFIT